MTISLVYQKVNCFHDFIKGINLSVILYFPSLGTIVRDSYPFKTMSSDIPLLIGSSSHAIAFWPGPKDLYNWSWNDYSKYVTTSLDSFGPRLAQMTLELYSSVQTDIEPMTPQLQYIIMVSELRQICPIDYLSEVLAINAKNPNIFRYVINARTSKPVSINIKCY